MAGVDLCCFQLGQGTHGWLAACETTHGLGKTEAASWGLGGQQWPGPMKGAYHEAKHDVGPPKPQGTGQSPGNSF